MGPHPHPRPPPAPASPGTSASPRTELVDVRSHWMSLGSGPSGWRPHKEGTQRRTGTPLCGQRYGREGSGHRGREARSPRGLEGAGRPWNLGASRGRVRGRHLDDVRPPASRAGRGRSCRWQPSRRDPSAGSPGNSNRHPGQAAGCRPSPLLPPTAVPPGRLVPKPPSSPGAVLLRGTDAQGPAGHLPGLLPVSWSELGAPRTQAATARPIHTQSE